MKTNQGILIKIFTGYRLKAIACFLLITMVFQVIYPTAALALTSGPVQPEFTSFEPVNTTQLVDNFTGDFNYNIPLLTVPGPNGGYPINLAYHAGIGMEEEASWVGLGWNLNVGEITRQVRGIPDDFNGNNVHKTTNMRDNWTMGIAGGLGVEIKGKVTSIGLDAAGKIYYNSYRGMGFSLTTGASLGGLINNDLDAPWRTSLDLTADSQSGARLVANIGLGGELLKKSNFELSAAFASRMGLYQLGLGYNHKRYEYKPKKLGLTARTVHTTHSNLSYESNPATPSTTPGLGGFSLNFTYKVGKPFVGLYGNAHVSGFLNTQLIADKEIDYKGYGYMYLHNADENGMMDYNREKQFPISPGVPSLPIPVMTHDIYSIKAQGAGGMFRAYRNDYGFLHEPATSNTFGDVNAGVDVGRSNVTIGALTVLSRKKGVNGGATLATSYSGKWKDGYKQVEDYDFKGRQEIDNINTYQDFYFKTFGEMTVEGADNGRYGGYALADLDIELGGDLTGIIEPKLRNKRIGYPTPTLSGLAKYEREKVNNNIEYFTLKELRDYNDGGFLIGGQNIYTSSFIYTGIEGDMDDAASDVIGDGGTAFTWDNNKLGSGDQVGAMRMRQDNGMVYEYGVPAMNSLQRDVVFSMSEKTGIEKQTQTYSASIEATKNNTSDSRDQYYSKTDIKDYAHSYLLTAVYSPDYVDVTGNGPSEDDLGYYTKFNYVKYYDDFKWRAPFSGASYNAGFYSDKRDDKGMYSYGEKEIYYLHSIETKTHVACFFLEPREDGFGVNAENAETAHGVSKDTDSPLQCLRQIRLYKKTPGDEGMFLLKTVNFEYDYSLCGGIPNHENTTISGTVIEDDDIVTNGKLTLKKVYFTHLQNTKGALSPYQFEYSTVNPAYNSSKVDRWGNYKRVEYKSGLDENNYSNEPDPYVMQSGTTASEDATAWNLSRIKLPSGGEIAIDYEADDYAYVQDKKAMQMFKIVGLADTIIGTDIPSLAIEGTFNNLYTEDNISNFVIFELDDPTNDPNVIHKLTENIDEKHPLFFKTFMRLKKNYNGEEESDQDAYDYVEGYCKINKDPDLTKLVTVNGGTQFTHGVLYVERVTVKQDDPGAGYTHPFSKAAWEYMKLSRVDLLNPEPAAASDLKSLANVFISMWSDLGTLFKGYYKRCKQKKYGNQIMFSNNPDWQPSYVRLNTPDGIKYGGGHRVKSIVTKDKWNEIANESNGNLDAEYGVEYSYRMPDGTSSGVATYEPMIGGEEIPLRLPSDRYAVNRAFTSNNKELYVTEPMGESFYPGASVGYRRVLVRNRAITGDHNKKTQGGINEFKFYTAKDFPVMISKTEVPAQLTPVTIPVIVPGVASLYSTTRGYSQGYKIELNNMHGQLHSMTTYAYGSNPDSPSAAFTSRVEHIYKTAGVYTDAGSNALSSTVSIIMADGTVATKELGASTEFYMDMQQNSSLSMSLGINEDHDLATITYSAPPLFFVLPVDFNKTYINASISKSNMRYAVTNKIINRHGILMETHTTKDGNTVIEKNLLFDHYNGQPALTSVTNEFGNPVYNYNYKGHWYYPNMGPSYENYNYSYTGNFTGNVLTSAAAATHLHKGDKVMLYTATTPQLAWVSDIDGSNNITFIDKEGDAVTGSFTGFRVVETIRKNLQSAVVGNLVTLDNPFFAMSPENNSPVFSFYNDYMDGYTHNNTSTSIAVSNPTVDLCEGTFYFKTVGIFLTNLPSVPFNQIRFYRDENPTACSAIINLSSITGLNAANIDEVRVYYQSSTQAWVKLGGADYLCPITYTGSDCTIPEPCEESGDPKVLHASATIMDDEWNYHFADAGNPFGSFDPEDNKWRSGILGTWRPKESYSYQVKRKQSSPTNIAEDGTYETFTKFDWSNPLGDAKWTLTNTITRYSPFGYELENKDVLGIYSSALYGHDHSVMTAMAANSSYFETAYDGFEDYVSGAGNYTRGHGHVNFTNYNSSGAGYQLPIATVPHTGKYSVYLSGVSSVTNTITGTFTPVPNLASLGSNQYFTPVSTDVNPKKYVMTFWAKPSALAAPFVTITGTVGSPVTKVGKPIEGWQRVEVVFETGDDPVDFSIRFRLGGLTVPGYVDDFRIQPFQSAMKSYAYDPNTLWLMAELDDRNYATFYNYDEEGNLVQVKKETEKGIMTIQTGRKNIRKPSL